MGCFAKAGGVMQQLPTAGCVLRETSVAAWLRDVRFAVSLLLAPFAMPVTILQAEELKLASISSPLRLPFSGWKPWLC